MSLTTAARSLIGKPFRHRGRGPKYFDCAGVVKESYRLNGVELPDFLLYGKEPHDDGLINRVTEALGEPVAVAPVRVEQLRVGDVVVSRFAVQPHHVAILCDYFLGGLSRVHACGHNGRVIEQRLSPDMIHQITHVFRRPL